MLKVSLNLKLRKINCAPYSKQENDNFVLANGNDKARLKEPARCSGDYNYNVMLVFLSHDFYSTVCGNFIQQARLIYLKKTAKNSLGANRPGHTTEGGKSDRWSIARPRLWVVFTLSYPTVADGLRSRGVKL